MLVHLKKIKTKWMCQNLNEWIWYFYIAVLFVWAQPSPALLTSEAIFKTSAAIYSPASLSATSWW